MKKTVFVIALAILLVSCTPAQDTASPGNSPVDLPPDTAVTNPPEQPIGTDEPLMNPYLPKPGDDNFTRGNVFIHQMELIIRESYPPQISLNLAGDLPTPCHQLRVDVADPTSENKVNIEAYTLVNPDMMCTQVIKPFEESIDLGTFPSGHYSVYVNGELAGEFDS